MVSQAVVEPPVRAPGGGRHRLRAAGRVDAAAVESLDRALFAALAAEGGTEVEVDLSAADHLDVSAVAVLLQAHFTAGQRGRRLRIVAGHGRVRFLLESCGVLELAGGDPPRTPAAGGGAGPAAPPPAGRALRWWRAWRAGGGRAG